MKGKHIDFYFREIGIGKLRIYHHVKIEATALGFAKLLLLLYLVQLECILRDTSLSAEEKVEKIKAKLSEWNKEQGEEVKDLVKLLEGMKNAAQK